jgi:circadian clock protein KaiC
VLPITALTLQHKTHGQRISSGVAALDDMMGGKGYYRGAASW